MAKHVSYFALAFGLPGCLPDSDAGIYRVTSYKQLMSILRDELDASVGEDADAGMAGKAIRMGLGKYDWRQLWHVYHQRDMGFSSLFLELPMANGVLNFMGLTEEEYNRRRADEERW